MYKRGVGVSVLSQYLQEANKQVEVWLQVGVFVFCSNVGREVGLKAEH